MATKFTTAFALGFVSLVASSANAQSEFESPKRVWEAKIVATAPAMPNSGYGANYGWGGHASTAAEGYLNGVGNVITAEGQYNYLTSLGNINNQTARSMAIENHKQFVQTFFEVRAINRAARAAELGPMPTNEQAAKWARDAAPTRLTASQFQPTTGQMHWPNALQDERYAGIRGRLQELFAGRSLGSSLDATAQEEVVELTASLRDDLQERINKINPNQYMLAKNFLASLDYETNFPSTTEAVAAR